MRRGPPSRCIHQGARALLTGVMKSSWGRGRLRAPWMMRKVQEASEGDVGDGRLSPPERTSCLGIRFLVIKEAGGQRACGLLHHGCRCEHTHATSVCEDRSSAPNPKPGFVGPVRRQQLEGAPGAGAVSAAAMLILTFIDGAGAAAAGADGDGAATAAWAAAC
jgi:hypothetical protein